jgi:hypothetical protein
MDLDKYEKVEIIMDAKQANIETFKLMLPIAFMIFIPYYILWKNDLTIASVRDFAESHHSSLYSTMIAFAVIIFGIIIHEVIHGVTWALFTEKGFKSISFGFLWKELTPYCHCSEPMPVQHYISGAMMPAVILGFIPSITAYVTGNIWWMLFGLFFTVAAAGDFMMIKRIVKENKNSLVQDHPSKIGCFVYRKISREN